MARRPRTEKLKIPGQSLETGSEPKKFNTAERGIGGRSWLIKKG
jgi:hypothetical protein